MKIKQLYEAPIYPTADPMDPVVKHGAANPQSLKTRIMISRRMLKELADMADTDDLGVWDTLTKMALGGGMTMGLVQNLEQIRHGIDELRAKRAKGGSQSRGIEKI